MGMDSMHLEHKKAMQIPTSLPCLRTFGSSSLPSVSWLKYTLSYYQFNTDLPKTAQVLKLKVWFRV